MNSQPPQAPQPPGAPTVWPTGEQPRKSGLATASLTCSLVGLIPCCAPLSLVGVILGGIGLASISKSRGQKLGKGKAAAGLVIGIVGIGWAIAFWITLWNLVFVPTLNAVNPVADKYLTLVSEGKYEDAYDLTSPEFKRHTSLEEFKRYNEAILKLDGEYKGKEIRIIGGGVSIASDSNGTTARITYSVDYTKRSGVGRSITFRKHGDTWLIEEDKPE